MKRYCRYISILNLQWKYCFKELILIIAGMAAAQLLLGQSQLLPAFSDDRTNVAFLHSACFASLHSAPLRQSTVRR